MERIIQKVTPPARKKAPKLKRVAAYARVSSGREAPLHSLSAQISQYSGMIQKTPGWQYAGVYADEALTGTKDSRGEFQRLLADCRAGKIDMIITKSVSRFARNTVTTLRTIRELRLMGVDVFFEEQNIHTMGEDGELLLTLLAAYAEEEARSVSENQKWRIKSNYEQGLPWSITMYGYRQVNGRLEVVPEEAEIIRLAADLYLEGYGRYKLEDAFAAVNIKGRHGANMGGNSIVELICNEKIVGDMLLQKTFVVDPITKEIRKNNGEKPQYFVEGSHEGILDRETYEKVLAERARRAAAYQPRSGSYERNRFPFSGKIHCGKCGNSFTRKVLNGNTPYEKRGWLCRTFNQKGKAHCDAKQIPEEILKRVSAEAMGLPEFDEAAFAAKVEEIQVPENGVLVFVFYDGHTVTKTWDNPSRRHSWNPENRQRARELALRQAAERRLAKCQQ